MTCGRLASSPPVAAASTPTSSSDTDLRWRSSTTAPGATCSSTDEPMAPSPTSKSSAPTCAPTAPPATVAGWISAMRASLVRSGLLPAEALATPTIYGTPPAACSTRSAPSGSCSSAFRASRQSTLEFAPTSAESDTPYRVPSSWTLPRWVLLMLGSDIGLLATPTTKANQCCHSMMKWPSCRRLALASGGRLTPEFYEWMMGWPIGASGSRPLATGWSRSARLPLTSCSADP